MRSTVPPDALQHVLRRARRAEGVLIPQVADLLEISYQAARRDVLGLVREGKLRRTGKRRPRTNLFGLAGPGGIVYRAPKLDYSRVPMDETAFNRRVQENVRRIARGARPLPLPRWPGRTLGNDRILPPWADRDAGAPLVSTCHTRSRPARPSRELASAGWPRKPWVTGAGRAEGPPGGQSQPSQTARVVTRAASSSSGGEHDCWANIPLTPEHLAKEGK